MGRFARTVVPGIPHHVVQRGNRRGRVFFSDDDRLEYEQLLEEQTVRHDVQIWAYCLMDNHVHLVAVPAREESLAAAIGEAHRLYTRRIHFREGWRGVLWQGRFGSCPLDEPHLLAAVRYVERNPVRAGLTLRAEDYRWSSARAHVTGTTDSLLSPSFLTQKIGCWADYLRGEDGAATSNELRLHARTGRPLGTSEFIDRLERLTGCTLRPKPPGPRPSAVSPKLLRRA